MSLVASQDVGNDASDCLHRAGDDGGYCAFDSTPLQKLKIPASVVEIDELAVRNCISLYSITVASGNTRYDSRYGCNAIMETQADKLLIGCMETEIPDGTKSIATYAFYGSEYLEFVVIPRSVAVIGDEAFSGCTYLTAVAVERATPVDITEDTFSSRYDATLYVPYGSKEAYEAADYWRDFYEIVETDVTGVNSLMADDRQGNVYDLMGRHLSNSKLSNSPMRSGLYIVGDKKVLVK